MLNLSDFLSCFAQLQSVIRRLVQLINDYARVIADQKASLSQAQSATQALNSYLDSDGKKSGKSDDKTGGDKSDAVQDELAKLRKELKTSKEEAKKQENQYFAMKRQSDSLTKEYDRLSEENATLQKKYDQLVSASGSSKKGD